MGRSALHSRSDTMPLLVDRQIRPAAVVPLSGGVTERPT
jgi:hypothetical protein